MDKRNWKKILLQWVTECEFMERNYFNIEQTDIEIFFQNFCKHHQKAGVSIALSDPKRCLMKFFKEFYPNFDIQLDEGNIVCADYTYVYSLFLHFSCVKFPSTYFHETCQKLPDQYQECIASFFKKLIDCTTINKETLHYAIAECGSANIIAKANDSSANVSPGIASPCLISVVDSPKKTPKRSGSASHRISPSTPKTTLLEERTRELYNLRAQLETERYEKGLLEVQIKQNEDKFIKLNQEHKKLQQQILGLKNDILNRHFEHSSQSRDDDQGKKKLIKEITFKEQEISKLADDLSSVKEEKTLAKEKLKFAEKNIHFLKSRIEELDNKVSELLAELEQKNLTIQYLTDNKNELEQFISETRSARQGFNTSVDCLDASYSRVTNSSGSTCSPENLGCSVIDIQLREKAQENLQLREELNALRLCNNRLAKQIDKCANRYSVQFEMCIDRSKNKGEEFADPADHFMTFLELVEKISNLYKNEHHSFIKLQEDTISMQDKNDKLTKRLEKFEEEVDTLKEKLNAAEKMRQDLQIGNKSIQEKLAQRLKEINILQKQNESLASNLDGITIEFDIHRSKCQDHQRSYTKIIDELKYQLDTSEMEKAEMSQHHIQLKAEAESLQNKLVEFEVQFSNSKNENDLKIAALNEKILYQRKEMNSLQSTEKMVKEKYEKLLILCEELKTDKRTTSDHLDAMRNELALKEMEMTKLGTEIVDVRTKNVELEDRINRLMCEYRNEKQNSDMAINKKEEHIKEIIVDRNKIQDALMKTQAELGKLESDFRNTQEEVNTMTHQIRSLTSILQQPFIEESSLSDLIEKSLCEITELVAFKCNVVPNLDRLEKENRGKTLHIESIEEKLQKALQDKQELVLKHEEEIITINKELEDSKQKVLQCDYLIDDLKTSKEKLEQFLKEENENIDRKVQTLNKEIKSHEDNFAIKERELNDAVNELKETKDNLLQSKQSSVQQQEEYKHKIQMFESKINEMSMKNEKLIEDVNAYKLRHADTEKRLQDADMIVNELSNKLKNNEHIIKEKMHTHAELEKSHAQEIGSLENYIQDLEKLKTEHCESILKMQQKLDNVSSEKEKLLQDIKDYTTQLMNEQKEKTTLLTSLENTASQLRIAVEQREIQATALEEQCSDLRSRLQDADNKNSKIQCELFTKEAELRVALEDHQQDQAKWELKLSKLRDDLKSKSTELDSHERTYIEILSTLENNFNLSIEAAVMESDANLFKVDDMRKSENKLKNVLNQLAQYIKDTKISKEKEKQEAQILIEELTKANICITKDVAAYKAECSFFEETLRNEVSATESKYTNDLKRLNEDIQNLMNVNDKLTDENANLQLKLASLEEDVSTGQHLIEKLSEDKNKILVDLSLQSAVIDRLKEGEDKCAIKNKEQQIFLENLNDKIGRLESELKEKVEDVRNTSKQLNKSNEDLIKSQYEIQQKQQKLLVFERELKVLNDKYSLQQTVNSTMESELKVKGDELSKVHIRNDELSNTIKGLERQLYEQSQKCDDALSQKLVFENKLELKNSQYLALGRDCEFLKTQLQTSTQEVERILRDVDELKREKLQLIDELKDNKRDLQRANDNVTELIQQISSIRLEKEAMMDENQLLRKQLEENSKNQTTSESKLKVIIERSQSFERNLLTSENDLKSLRNHLEKSEAQIEKLRAENFKAHEGHDMAVKRLERLALKLGDTQASFSKLERENEKLMKIIESHCTTIEELQMEKDGLHNELKALKERLLNSERAQEKILEKTQLLELANVELKESKRKLEISENEVKLKITKLEKLRDTNEEKIRKLNHELNNSENAKVHLSLQIGALNSELCLLKNSESSGDSDQLEEMANKITKAEEHAAKYIELCNQLEIKTKQLQEENANIQDQLSKMALSLKISRGKCEKLSMEMETLHGELGNLRQQKAELERDHIVICGTLKDMELENVRLSDDKLKLEVFWEAKVNKLAETLDTKTQQISDLKDEIERIRYVMEKEKKANENYLSTDENATDLVKNLDSTKLALEKEMKTCAQFRMDNQILQSKYKEAKERIIVEAAASEERIKDNRLELEGKLEKMKNKMKTLYTEEIAKMKTKQEREIGNLKSEMEVVRLQNVKYEDHTKKLSSQIVRLNDKLLEQQKQNTILSTKLKHMQEEHESLRFKRPSSIHIAGSLTSTSVAATSNIGSNLEMEDEEGEVFNNTYLTDLKNGRVSELLGKDVCAEELQYRNSLLPPHLKSTYAAQYDHGLPEDELKDGPPSLDDSMSALLSTTSGGTRKKITGVTHYKRPGPPTPSKHGGRLSFGGSTEPTREILKETYVNNAGAVSSTSKTPSRFGFFSSRFSMGNVKDENSPPKRRLSNIFKRK